MFQIFPRGFYVNPFHTSNTSVLLQAFLSFLSIQIYMWGKNSPKLLAVIVQFLRGDFYDEALSISLHCCSGLSTQHVLRE